jgi:hypothetical protein
MPAPSSSPFQGLVKTLDDKWSKWQEEMALDFKDMVYKVDEEEEHMINASKDRLDLGLKKDMKYLEEAAVKELKEIFYDYKGKAKSIFLAGVSRKNIRKQRHDDAGMENEEPGSGDEQQQGSGQDAGGDNMEQEDVWADWRYKNKRAK